MNIIIYGATGCSNCERLKMYAKRKGVDYQSDNNPDKIIKIAKEQSIRSLPILSIQLNEDIKYFAYPESLKKIDEMSKNIN